MDAIRRAARAVRGPVSVDGDNGSGMPASTLDATVSV